MSYFNMVCDSCGREVYGCNIVNGMKFCAKCYQETFGETDKDKQIAELQKQLERHNKYFNSFSCDNFDEFADFISTFMLTPHEEQILIKDLKKQLEEKEKKIEKLREGISQCEADRKCEQEKKNLAFKELRERSEQLRSQPAEIVEKIKNYKGEYFEWKIGDKIYPAFKITEEDLDNILKEYQK